MKYELAKQLKDKGFEMDYNLDGFSNFDKKINEISIELTDLINACGESLVKLERVSAPPNASLLPTMWKVTGYKNFGFDRSDGRKIEITDFSLEEAVAELWLELNK